MMTEQPGRKSLFLAWLVLMALSVGTLLTGRVSETSRLGPALLLSLLVLTGLKATWILRHFLNLRAAPRGWNLAFMAYLVVLLSVIFGIYLYGWLN